MRVVIVLGGVYAILSGSFGGLIIAVILWEMVALFEH